MREISVEDRSNKIVNGMAVYSSDLDAIPMNLPTFTISWMKKSSKSLKWSSVLVAKVRAIA
jgi:hypothetical protein